MDKETFKYHIIHQFRQPYSPLWNLMRQKWPQKEVVESWEELFVKENYFSASEYGLLIKVEKESELEQGFLVRFIDVSVPIDFDLSNPQYVLSARFTEEKIFIRNDILYFGLEDFYLENNDYQFIEVVNTDCYACIGYSLSTGQFLEPWRIPEVLEIWTNKKENSHEAFSIYLDYIKEGDKHLNLLRHMQSLPGREEIIDFAIEAIDFLPGNTQPSMLQSVNKLMRRKFKNPKLKI